jgi:Flp pilus assembly protein TadD
VSVAEQELRSGSPALALQMTQSILQHTPDDVTALLIQGDAAAQLGKAGDANTAFTHALRLQPTSVRGQLGLGRLRLATDPTEAATLFGEVVKREPNNVNAWNNLGIARDLLGQHREAQEAYRRVHALDASNTAGTVNMALSLAMSGDGADGVALIAPLATAPSASAQLRHDYAVVLALAGRETEAGQILAHDLPPDQVKQALDAIRQQRPSGS